jgi:hypothetical protein
MPVDTVEQHIEPVMRYAYDIIVALAGRASEKILTGEIFNSVGGDYRVVQRNLWLLAVTGFFGPRMAMSVEGGIAANMNDKTLENYWLQMEDATDKLLRRHWREVTALAEELLVKTTLNGKEVVDIIEANQSVDTLREDNIVPKTLAAIRAQALAEIRNAGALRQPDTMPNGVMPNDDVIIINGSGNGTAVVQAKPTTAAPVAPTASVKVENVPTPPQPTPTNNGTPQNNDGPTLLNDSGSYEPKLADDDPNKK